MSGSIRLQALYPPPPVSSIFRPSVRVNSEFQAADVPGTCYWSHSVRIPRSLICAHGTHNPQFADIQHLTTRVRTRDSTTAQLIGRLVNVSAVLVVRLPDPPPSTLTAVVLRGTLADASNAHWMSSRSPCEFPSAERRPCFYDASESDLGEKRRRWLVGTERAR